MTKTDELKEIDDFIIEFNHQRLGVLRRISGEEQENPDAICELNNGEKRIGLENTIAVTQEDIQDTLHPKPFNPQNAFYNTSPAIDAVIERVRQKSLNDYKGENMNETWLVITGGSGISIKELRERLKNEDFVTRFNRIFVHKGLIGEQAKLAEITPLS